MSAADMALPGPPRPRKRFGQHFLESEAVLAQMAAVLRLKRADRLIEIGPGTGALTQYLAEEVDNLIVIEIDRDLVAGLRRRFPRVEVIEANILQVDLPAILGDRRDWRIIGNLPYNISTPLLGRLLELLHAPRDTHPLRDMHFLLQREVVNRLAAKPSTKDWGRLSVMAQARLDVEPLFEVGPENFRPPPKVWSTFVRLRPRFDDSNEEANGIIDNELFVRLVRDAFQQRRKRLSNALQSWQIDWSRAPVDAGLRPDAVDLAGYIALTCWVIEARAEDKT